jgi:hypothetical protein
VLPRSKFGSEGKTAVVSTINGDANVPFTRTRQPGLKAGDIPVVAFSVSEELPASTPTGRASRRLEPL